MRIFTLVFIASLLFFADITHSEVEVSVGMLETEDGETISYRHHDTGHEAVVIISPGFFNNKDTLTFRQLAEEFIPQFDVISFDLTGHGKSSGRFHWTANEASDLRAVIKYAKEYGYKKIGVLSFSMAAVVTILEGSQNESIDSIIAVSTPSNVWKINYHFWEPETWRDLSMNLGPKGRGKGVRPGSPFHKKTPPIDVVHKVSPTPILFIHGKKDWLIEVDHSRDLYEAALEPKEFYLFPNAGHAEKIYDREPRLFINICTEWFQETLGE